MTGDRQQGAGQGAAQLREQGWQKNAGHLGGARSCETAAVMNVEVAEESHHRNDYDLLEQSFSLIVSILAPGMDIYSLIRAVLAVQSEIEANG